MAQEGRYSTRATTSDVFVVSRDAGEASTSGGGGLDYARVGALDSFSLGRPTRLNLRLSRQTSEASAMGLGSDVAKRKGGGLRGLARGALSSVTAASGNLWASVTASQQETCLRKQFEAIDVQRKGYIDVADLEGYAERQGLPSSYASKFLAYAGRFASTSKAGEGQQQEQQEQPGSPHVVRVEDGRDGALCFTNFKKFVKAREVALQKAFDMFDKDGDGRISPEDLELSLRHVSVSCSASRCVYRCKKGSSGSAAVDAAREALFARAQRVRSGGTPGAPGADAAGGPSGGKGALAAASKISFCEFRSFFLLLPENSFMVDYWLAAGTVPDLDTKVATHEPHEANKSHWGHLVAGALAGAASRTATAPLETLRLAVMTGALEPNDLMQGAALLMARGGGWPALFRGNAVNVMRSGPSKALDFFAFDNFKRMLGGSDDPISPLATFAAAGMAGASSWTILYPLEVVRSRITTGTAPPEAGGNPFKVMRSIVAANGPKALYRGLGWSVAAIIPEAAICYGLHDLLKRAYKRVNHAEPGVLIGLSFGILSAFCGQLLTYPLEAVSRRLQVSSGASFSGIVAEIMASGGPAAFYRGLGASTLRLVPMAAVSFGTYELARSAIIELEQLQVDFEFRREGDRALATAACDDTAVSAGLCPQVDPAAPSPPCEGESGGGAPRVVLTAKLPARRADRPALGCGPQGDPASPPPSRVDACGRGTV